MGKTNKQIMEDLETRMDALEQKQNSMERTQRRLLDDVYAAPSGQRSSPESFAWGDLVSVATFGVIEVARDCIPR